MAAPADIDISKVMRMIRDIAKNNVAHVGIATVEPGNTVAEDDCCEGKLWVRLVSLVGAPAMSRPGGHRCALMFQARIALGIARCAHTVDDQGHPPSPDDMSADAYATFKDMQDLLRVLQFLIPEIKGVETLKIEQWLPTGPSGGCVSGEWVATFNYLPDICNEE